MCGECPSFRTTTFAGLRLHRLSRHGAARNAVSAGFSSGAPTMAERLRAKRASRAPLERHEDGGWSTGGTSESRTGGVVGRRIGTGFSGADPLPQRVHGRGTSGGGAAGAAESDDHVAHRGAPADRFAAHPWPFPAEGDAAVRDAMETEIASLLKFSRAPADDQPSSHRGKRRKTSETKEVPLPTRFNYTKHSAHIRGFFEDKKDWQRSEAMVEKRKRAAPGRFDSYKLQKIERFALQTSRGGLSQNELKALYNLISVIEGTKEGMPHDDGQDVPVTDTFQSAEDFKKAASGDLDDAVLQAGWRSCAMEEGGVKIKAFFRPALDLILALLRTRTVRLWSGGDKPPPPSDQPETPMQGDAFRLCEAEVDKLPWRNYVLGLHVFSDSCQLSWSGGMSSLSFVS